MVRGVLAAVAMLVLGFGAGCDDQSCSLADCDHAATVTFPAGLAAGPYDLALAFDGGETLAARCADPGAPELADNPEGLTCDAGGFTLTGSAAGNRTVRVTISDTDSGDVLVSAAEVRLEAVDELRPNGPDCAPVCFIRNGQLTAPM